MSPLSSLLAARRWPTSMDDTDGPRATRAIGPVASAARAVAVAKGDVDRARDGTDVLAMRASALATIVSRL